MSDETPNEHTARIGRGVFLATVAGGVSSLFWGKAAWSRVSGVVSPVAEAVAPILPSSGWRIYSVADRLPTFDPATWKLTIGGLVSKPRSLNYDELRALPRVEQISTFHCVTGWTVQNVHWAGVRIADVIGPAVPHGRAHALRFVSAEHPYADYLTIQQASLHDVLLAYEMDGKPLSRGHGAPLRVVIPDMYGYKNVKWLDRIELVPSRSSSRGSRSSPTRRSSGEPLAAVAPSRPPSPRLSRRSRWSRSSPGVGAIRGWRSTLIGAGSGFVVLPVVGGGLGVALTRIPTGPLRLAIGGLLLVFGLQWYRKAVRRVAEKGFAGDDEEEIEFDDRAGTRLGLGLDRVRAGLQGRPARGAGVLFHRSLTRIPRSVLILVVGLLLSTFGTFWGAGGIGWPAGDLALPVLLAFYSGAAASFVFLQRRHLLGGGLRERPRERRLPRRRS